MLATTARGKRYYAYANPPRPDKVHEWRVPWTLAQCQRLSGLYADPDTGTKTISYTNQGGILCFYEQKVGGKWVWVDMKVQAK